MTRTAAVVALIVVACGETGCGGSSGDATMLDADTGPDAVATGPVRLTFSSPRQPAGGVPVIFLDVDDREVATVMTDASGVAEAVMGPGGSVTAVDSPIAVSFLGVEPGDDLRWGGVTTPVRTLDVRLPAATGTSIVYYVQTSCGTAVSDTVGLELRVLADCALADIYVSASERLPPNRDYGAFFVAGVALPPTGIIDLATHTYAPATAITTRVAAVPARFTAASAKVLAHGGRRDIWVRTSDGTSTGPYAGDLTSAAMQTLRVPAIGASELMVRTDLTVPTGGFMSSLHVADVIAPTPTYALDLASVTVPVPSSLPALDATAANLVWTEPAGGAADWISAQVIFVDGQRLRGLRQLIAPYRSGALHIPSLPAPYADVNPAPTDDASIEYLYIGSSPGGFRTLRNRRYDPTIGDPPLRDAGDRLVYSQLTRF